MNEEIVAKTWHVKRSRELCTKCSAEPRRAGQRWCLDCHAAHMRANRPRHSELTPVQRRKANARSYANVYQGRGKLLRQSCEMCGDSQAQKHHPDYSRPLLVVWLCRRCHLDHHAGIHRKEAA